MAEFEFNNLTVEECIEAKALLDNRLKELGQGKNYKSLEQSAMVVRNALDNLQQYLADNNVDTTNFKISSEMVNDIKTAVNNILEGNITKFKNDTIQKIKPYAFYEAKNLKDKLF